MIGAGDIERLKAKLVKAASRPCRSDDPEFCPGDFSGGNADDCFGMGVSDGEVIFAQELLAEFFPEVQIKREADEPGEAGY